MSAEGATEALAKAPAKAAATPAAKASPSAVAPMPVKSPEPAKAPLPVEVNRQAPTAVQVLAYARVVPFVAMSLIVALAAPSPSASSALTAEIGYGAVLLSFLGGARWGVAVKAGGAALFLRPLALTMLPTFFSWCVLFLAPPVALGALMAGFLLVMFADRASARQTLVPAWQSGLELTLTAMTEIALGVSLASALLA